MYLKVSQIEAEPIPEEYVSVAEKVGAMATPTARESS